MYEAILRPGDALAIPAYWLHCVRTLEGPSFAYSLPVHSLHTRRDRVASLPPCRLHGAAIQKSLTTRARLSPDLAVWLG